MRIHANATLTIKQREEVKRLHTQKRISIRKLARRFKVSTITIKRWIYRDSPLDLSTAPKHKRGGLTPEQQEAVLAYRQENPQAGERTIALALKKQFGKLSHASIGRYLKACGLTHPLERKDREKKPLKVGKHRLQMDIQQLPAVRGGQGFEYKISIIHMATRMKYSEIHPQITAQAVAQSVEHALGQMPPFFLIWTDNAWVFTTKYHRWGSDRCKTAMDKLLDKWGLIHALIPKGQPWKNGIVERVHRTDNENLFRNMTFSSSEERRYYLWLWDRYYNFQRPHQGIDGLTPVEKFIELFPFYARFRMLN